ncbi:MAG: hypothetical protein ACYCW6_26300, partial [Candidatus Xenobia bacterium]
FQHEHLHVVEAKTSRSDYLADESLRHYTRVADVCWLICPRGLLRPDELPDGWGLLYADEQTCEIAKRAPRLKPTRPLHAHWDALLRACSRKLSRGYLGIRYQDGRPHPQPVDCLEL